MRRKMRMYVASGGNTENPLHMKDAIQSRNGVVGCTAAVAEINLEKNNIFSVINGKEYKLLATWNSEKRKFWYGKPMVLAMESLLLCQRYYFKSLEFLFGLMERGLILISKWKQTNLGKLVIMLKLNKRIDILSVKWFHSSVYDKQTV